MALDDNFPEILEDSDNMEEVAKVPAVVETTVEEEKPEVLVGGYTSKELDMIESSREIRSRMLKDLTANGTPRGKDLESTASLLNDQENSAHKTAAIRVKVKSEDTKAVVASAIMGMLFDERNKALENGNDDAVIDVDLPSDFIPDDIVDGETSNIVKNNDLNVDDFMPTEKEM